MIKALEYLSYLICFLFLLIAISSKAYAEELPTQYTQSARILIFVSSSMPDASLVQWIQEARSIQPHAALIMRGFVHDSLPDTRAFVGRLVKASNGQGGVSIDPVLFKTYGIKEVPAVVVEINNSVFDVVYGNTSLNTALQIIAKSGSTASAVKNILANNDEAND